MARKELLKDQMGEDDLKYWSQNYSIIGIDEAGRGPIAGSMFFALVSFDINNKSVPNIGLKDSKKLSDKKIFELENFIKNNSKYFIQEITVDSINNSKNINILGWNAVNSALNQFIGNYIVFMDGKLKIPNCPFKQIAKPKFDSCSWHVAAASVLAKAAQIRAMEKLNIQYPGYGFSNHRGYGTLNHFEAIKKLGLTQVHRHKWIKL